MKIFLFAQDSSLYYLSPLSMGNWNRRYIPRKKYRQYDYEDLPASPRSYNYEAHSSGLAHSRVPKWEIDYCHSVKVPWNKILASKKYIYSYPSVLNWDGSAGKEALENAKQRYWAMLNGLPCGTPLPEPDMYIDKIDWDPYIDPELMADLELQVFNPDETQKVEQLEAINEDVECPQTQNDKNQYSSNNPWERDHVLITESSTGWGRCDDAVNLKNDDPWEQNCRELVDSSKSNVWRSGDDSWNCNEKTVNARQDGWGDTQGHVWRSGIESWNCNEKTAGGWGQGERRNNSWSQNAGTNNGRGPVSFGNNNSVGIKERGWRDNRNASWGVRDAGHQGNESKYWDPYSRQGGQSYRGGGRKRESSFQHTSKYKTSRYLGDSY